MGAEWNRKSFGPRAMPRNKVTTARGPWRYCPDMAPLWRRRLGMLAALAIGACDASPPGRFVVYRDSADVRIVESLQPRWSDGEAWSIDSIPVLDLSESGDGPAHEFYRIRDVITLRDGAIAVASYSSSDIRVFSGDGKHLRTYGRKGRGPGEFDRLLSIHEMPGDSILAFDSWLGRFTTLRRAMGS